MVGAATYGYPARSVLMPASISALLIDRLVREEELQGDDQIGK